MQSPQNGSRDRGDDADLARAVAIALAPRDLAAVARRRPARAPNAASSVATISAAGTTSSMRQPLVVPTSMYSMKRSVSPRARGSSAASGTIWSSLTPRLTTQLTLTGSPAAAAASIPSSTRLDGEVDVVHRPEGRVVERVEADRDPVEARVRERLGLARRAASRSSSASGRRRAAASISISRSRSRRTSGSPPVSRSFSTPSRRRNARDARDLLEVEQLAAARGSGSRGRRPPSACSRCSGSCSGR